MKKIFDGLREKCKSHKVIPTMCNADVVNNLAITHCIEEINEAEAKWEAECCERDFAQRMRTVIPLLEVNVLYGAVSLIKDLADALGIKISEVE